MEEKTEGLRYVTAQDDITKALVQSREHGNVIGIFAISLGPQMIMTAVEQLIQIKNDLLILLKETDLLGIALPEDQILLSEIVRVLSFKTLFNDPFHVQLREKHLDHQIQ